MARKIVFLFLLAFLAGSALATTTTTVVSPSSDGNYLSGTQAIVFRVLDDGVIDDINALIYYSTTQGAFSNLISGIDLNAENCGDNDFTSENSCTFSWTTTGIADGNYYIDINVSSYVNENILTIGTDSSDNDFVVDNAVPSINFKPPSTGGTNESKIVAFDLNDAFSGIKISEARVDINGTPSTSFNTAKCTSFGLNYACSYTESGFDTNNSDYNVTVFVKDITNNATQATVILHYLNTTPAQVTNLTATAGNMQVILQWSAVNVDDLNSYLVYMSTTQGFTTDSSTLIATIAAGTTNLTKTSLTNGTTYYFRVSAKDTFGNEGIDSDEKNAVPAENATNIPAPAINSSTHTNDVWSSNNEPVFSWDVNSSLTYKCVFDQNSGTIPSSDCSSPRNPDGSQEGVWYFHLRACDSLGNCSSASHFKAKIDRSGPQQVTGLSVEANSNGTITVSWTSVSDNPSGENSGIREYQVYRHFDSGFEAIDSRRIAVTGSTSYIDDGDDLAEETRYYYKVRAVDTLGNAGSLSGEVSALFQGEVICENEFTFNFSDYIGGEKFTIIVTSDSAMTNPELKVRIVDGQTGFIAAENIDTTSTSVTGIFPISESLHEKTAEVTLKSLDQQGNQCLELKRTRIDRGKPAVSFSGLEEGNDLLLDKDISIVASDAHSGIKEVKLYYRQRQTDFSLLGTASKISDDTFEVSSSELSGVIPGKIELKAEAIDKAGNKSETALELAAKTSEGVIGQQELEFNGDLIQVLQEKGLPEDFSLTTAALFEKTKPTRTIEVFRINGEIRAKFTVSFVNNATGENSFKIIEVIPKSLAQTASQLTSEHAFNVILDDPIIEFEVSGLGEGEMAVVSYELKESLSEEQANELLQQNILSEFELPPLVVQATEKTGEIFSTQKQIFQPDLLFFLIIIVIIIVVVLILGFVAVGGLAIFHLHKKSKESQIDKKLSEMEGGMMQKTSDQLKKWLEKKEAEKPKKFSWKPDKR